MNPGLFSGAVLDREEAAFLPVPEKMRYGTWTKDEQGLPCFDASFDGGAAAMERSFLHGFSSGRLNVLVNRWGLVHLFTTEGGYTDFSANTGRVRSGLHLELLVEGERHVLIYNDLQVKNGVRYGIGYAEFSGIWRHGKGMTLEVVQRFYTPPDREGRMGASFRLNNPGRQAVRGTLRICAGVESARDKNSSRQLEYGKGFCCWKDFHPGLGDYQLRADEAFQGLPQPGASLILERGFCLEQEGNLEARAQVGYGGALKKCPGPAAAQKAWAGRLESAIFTGIDPWMAEEAVWSLGQLYSFEAYDSSAGEHYLNLGGYGWAGFGAREVPETAMTVAAWDPGLAFSCLRWTAKIQYQNGDIPHCHAFRRPEPGEQLSTGHRESDNEIWFVLACAEVIRVTGREAFLDEVLPFWDGGEGTVLEHLRRAVLWIREGVGTGVHGLIRIAEGDWNDYLSHVGRNGRGESMMNTGMACAALGRLAPLVLNRDPVFAAECGNFLASLRAAAAAAFDGTFFVRGYTDEGRPFGTEEEDRVFINAQSWCVLGGCGTREMRETALRSVLEKCFSPLGLTLMSRPYSCPPPPEVSTCPIPVGEGENGGVWPQTVHWVIWALVELGWKEEAREVWKRMSLRNHARLHPETPFGIFNGPDCYSSHFSGEREGWTQVEMLARASFPPMNPMVAWQAFSLGRILE